MSIKIQIYLILFLFLLFSCKNNNESSLTEPKFVINLDTIEMKGVMPFSSIFKSVKPIFLETSEDNLVSSIDVIEVIDSLIFILDRKYKRLFCFDIKGNYLRKIGSVGGGPGEYSNISDFTIDSNDKTLYLVDYIESKIHSYKLTGEYVKTLSLSDKLNGNIGHIQIVDNSIFTDLNPSKPSSESPLLVEIDKISGKVLNKYLDDDNYNIGFRLIIFKDNSYFYNRSSSHPLYCPRYSNEVFLLKENEEPTPYLKFNSSKFLNNNDTKDLNLFEYSAFGEIEKINKITSIYNIIEFGDYVICIVKEGYKLNYLVFSKKNADFQLYHSLYDDFIFNSIGESIPFFYLGSSDERGVYCFIKNEQLNDFINYYKSNSIKYHFNESELEKLKNLTAESNPIIFFYSLDDN